MPPMSSLASPTVLVILDGFGYREASENNAIFHAATPTFDRLWREGESTLVSGSGLDVGLPEGQMGNSEVGHMSLGSGRIIYQSITRIDKAIDDGDFEENEAYCDAIDKAVATSGAVHLFGLLSPGGVHSHENHIFAAARLAQKRGASAIYLHAFLDGRDTPPRSAQASLERAETELGALGVGRIATVQGRYFAMDRDKRWDRIALATKLLVDGDAEFSFGSVLEALDAAYTRDENDEPVAPSRIGDTAITDVDAILFMNFRADRARQPQALTDPGSANLIAANQVPFATTEYYEGLNASAVRAGRDWRHPRGHCKQRNEASSHC